MQDYRPLGEILIEKGKLTAAQLDIALAKRHGQKRRLGGVLISLGYVREEDVAECLGEQYGLQVVDVMQLEPDAEALNLIDPSSAIASRVLPVSFVDDCLECVIADPIDVSVIDLMNRTARRRVVFRIAPISALLEAIRRAYHLEVADRRSSRRATFRPVASKIPERDRLLALIREQIGDETGHPGLKTAIR